MKSSTFLKKGLVTLASAFYCFAAIFTWADDTDIYLHNPNLDSSVKPNVMFILDNSGSMSSEVSGDDSRMDVMQEAFADIMQHSSNLNVGLMKLNRRDGESSRLVYPVTDIDKPIDNSIIIEGTPSIESSADDAYELTSSGQTVINSTSLPIGQINSGIQTRSVVYTTESVVKKWEDNPEGLDDDDFWYGGYQMNFHDDQINALMFRNLAIPANATITDAYVTFTAADDDRGDARISVSAELSKRAAAFDNKKYRHREKTGQKTWIPSQWNNSYTEYTTQDSLDLAAIIQELLDSEKLNWSAGEELNRIALFFESKEGERHAFKITRNDEQKSFAARLNVSYIVGNLSPEPATTALRFQNVGIPQGATVTSASLEFTAAEDSDNTSMNVEIRVGDPGSSANTSFSEDPFDLTNRPKNAVTPLFRTLGPWTEGTEDNPNTYSIDVQDLLQRLVNSENWCGNDVATFFLSAPSGFRRAHSFDGNNGLKPRLKITHTGGKAGCKNEIFQKRIAQGSHDAFQNDKIKDRENYLLIDRSKSTNTVIGLHYPRFPIKQGSKILSATLEMTAREDQPAGGASFQIQADNVDHSSPINPSQKSNLSERDKTAASINWSPSEWEQGRSRQSPDITSVIQEIVDRPHWTAGNNLTLLLTRISGSLEVYSYEGNPSLSPRLKVMVEPGGIDQDSGYKVRDHLISLVDGMYAKGGTPITPTYYDMAKYYQDEWISGQGVMNNECQANYAVLLTDGQANGNGAQGNINKLINSSSCRDDSSDDDEECARSLAAWLHDTDLTNTTPGQQNVITNTIAFALHDSNAIRFLQDIASHGGGDYYTADNAAELAEAFNNIITGIIEDESSFVSPGVTANQFNNSRHLSQVYYSVFKPSKTDRWEGNLKRYQLIEDPENGLSLDVYDQRPELAVDKETGFFKESAYSFWSTEVDGRKVNIGGSGEHIPSATSRKLLTFMGGPEQTPVTLNGRSNDYIIHKNNDLILNSHLGLATDADNRRDELLDWVRKPANWYGDPLHSVPALTTYGCAVQEKYCPEEHQQLGIFFGTNDGFLHGIDAKTGIEQFAFMPRELLKNLDKLEANKATDRVHGVRPYGMDGSVTLWVNDVNKNGVIYGGYDTLNEDNTSEFLDAETVNSDEFVYAYIGMRRGGRSYYALDITAPTTPRLLWYIDGSDPENFPKFTKLGQTWSKPVKTRIKVGGNVKDVLIFSGGYDNSTQDAARLYAPDTMGNAIYIVDARTGEHIWSASNDSDAKATLRLSKMNYSIPGGVRVIDLEGDGLADQMLFADVGGQVWRLYINNCTSEKTSECAVDGDSDSALKNLVWPGDSDGDGTWTKHEGVFADLGVTASEKADDNEMENTRRFFVEPDASLFRLNGATHLALAIGTGNRPDPLGRINDQVLDRAYVIASPDYANPPVNKAYLIDSTNKVPAHTMIRHGEGQLLDITTNLNATAEQVFGESVSAKEKGWFITLEPGEKVMTESVTFEDTIYFNTYLPSDDITRNCNPVAGKARAYAVDLLTGKPANEDLENPTAADRYTNLANSGLPPTTSILFPEGSKDALICVGAECEPLEIGVDKQTTYWRQVR